MTRGVVLGLSLAQVAQRARYLGQLVASDQLDEHVHRDGSVHCPDGYYLLNEHNGGKDPTAPDPFDRWSKDGSAFVNRNRTADCIGGAAWCGGWDRYQPQRFAHIYEGWINTDSMLLDAQGPARCFEILDRPVPGCYVVAPTHAKGFESCGHIGIVHAVPPEWDPDVLDCWRHTLVVDVASRGAHPANRPREGGASIWYAARRTSPGQRLASAFVRSVMTV